MQICSPSDLLDNYDLAVIGSGFGSLFFLQQYLTKAPKNAKVVVLEYGPFRDYTQQIAEQKNTNFPQQHGIEVPEGHKKWIYTLGLGGGTNCWFGQTPRMLPADFQVNSLYGVGVDWPISYASLEPWYCDAEDIMNCSGPDKSYDLFPRSRPYPLPPHLPSTPDKVMLAKYPHMHMITPSARASIPAGSRNQCCSTGTCNLCPMNAKFTAHNGLRGVLDDERVVFVTNADVKQLDVDNNIVTAAVFLHDKKTYRVQADLVVLGANAIFNAAILYRSGQRHQKLGRGIFEQVGYEVEVKLDGMKNFDGSTFTTTFNYSEYDGQHRQNSAAALLFFENKWRAGVGLRKEFQRWRELLPITFALEDLPSPDNYIEISEDWDKPVTVHHAKHSVYADRGVQRVLNNLPNILSDLPVESIVNEGYRGTEAHLLGTTIMGSDPELSICDQNQVHHQYRNLLMVGSSVFPSAAPANPSLTVAALSLRAASLLQ